MGSKGFSDAPVYANKSRTHAQIRRVIIVPLRVLSMISIMMQKFRYLYKEAKMPVVLRKQNIQ